MKYRPDIWLVKDVLRALEVGASPRIIVPRFQRSKVWDAKRESSFISSLKKGFPVGSLLLAELNDGPSKTLYLVDGLQRTLTMHNFFQNPQRYVSAEEFPEAVYKDLAGLFSVPPDEMLMQIQQWAQSLRSMKAADGFDPYRLLKYLGASENGSDFEKKWSLGGRVIDTIRETVDSCMSLRIPVTIYTGDPEYLPDIFQKINQSEPVSQLQVLAATWSHSAFELSNKELLSHIQERYEKLRRHGMLVEGIGEGPVNKAKVTLFEYVYSLGKQLPLDYPELFSNSRGQKQEKDRDINPSVFQLVRLCLDSDIKSLPDTFARTGQPKFEEKLHKATKYVQRWLRPHVGIRLNRKELTAERLPHVDLQINAIISVVYNAFGTERWNEQVQGLRLGIPMWYLYDVLARSWNESSGFKNERMLAAARAGRFLRPPTREEWENCLDGWFAQQLDIPGKAVRGDVKLFLRYLYSHKVSVHDDAAVTHELEHLIPVSRLESAVKRLGGTVPISCVANLALLDKPLNNKKKDQTLAEYFTNMIAKGVWSQDQMEAERQRVRSFVFGDPLGVGIPQTGGTDGITKEWYMGFLKDRWALVKNEFFRQLNASGFL